MRYLKTKQERTKESIIRQSVAKVITAQDAANRLGLTVRQVENLKKKMREGISFLHGNCGRVSEKRLDDVTRQKVIDEYKKIEKFSPNFTHFHEILSQKGVKISYTGLRSILTESGIKSPMMRRAKKSKAHKSRDRREKFGELLQTDATSHEWLMDGNKYALHGFIDDATGRVTALWLSYNECMDGYLEIMRQTLIKYGTPEAIYADGLSMFFGRNQKEELTVEEELSGIYERKTQFGEICDTLGIDLIHASSSQAKGRIERLWKTLQSRLPVEFGQRGIKDIDSANRFLAEYLDEFNAQFGVNEETTSCFVKLPETVNLDLLLSYKTTRKTDSGCVFSLNNVKLRVEGSLPCRQIEVRISSRLGVVAVADGKIYSVTPIGDQKKKITSSDSAEMIFSRFVFAYCLKNEHVA